MGLFHKRSTLLGGQVLGESLENQQAADSDPTVRSESKLISKWCVMNGRHGETRVGKRKGRYQVVRCFRRMAWKASLRA